MDNVQNCDRLLIYHCHRPIDLIIISIRRTRTGGPRVDEIMILKRTLKSVVKKV
jgi:hypothetical protein